jgi:Protein of unknown function (DUF2867)
MQQRTAIECSIPLSSGLQPNLVSAAYFSDAYRAPLSAPPLELTEIFFAIFDHHPSWVKSVLLARNRIAKLGGLLVAEDSLILNSQRRENLKVGDTIGPWPIFSISDHELIAGRDNGHLDFRLSILRELNDGSPTVVVSTVCIVHNWFGKAYLFFIIPFHKWGVNYIISRALKAGRL